MSENNKLVAKNNNPCGICRAMGFLSCKGHGGGGGSDSSNNSGETNTKAGLTASNQSPINNTAPMTDIAVTSEALWIESQLFSNKIINYDAGLFFIESDRLRGNLIFQIKPELTNADIQIALAFLNIVKNEFAEFKNQLADQGIPVNKFTADLKDNKLTIHIPVPKYYDAFIKRLESKNLLPVPNAEWREKKIVENEADNKVRKYNSPSPLGDISKGPRTIG